MVAGMDAIALFTVVGVSMVTSAALLVRVLAREFGSHSRGAGG